MLHVPWLPAGECFWHLGKAVKSRRGLELPPPQLRKEAIPTLCLSSSPVLGKLYRSLQKPWQVHGYSVPLRGTRSCLDLQLVRTFFIFQTRFLPSVKAGNAITVPGSVVAWNKETRQYPKKIHKEEKKHSQYCPVFIDTVSLCHLFTRGVTCQQLHQYCFM